MSNSGHGSRQKGNKWWLVVAIVISLVLVIDTTMNVPEWIQTVGTIGGVLVVIGTIIYVPSRYLSRLAQWFVQRYLHEDERWDMRFKLWQAEGLSATWLYSPQVVAGIPKLRVLLIPKIEGASVSDCELHIANLKESYLYTVSSVLRSFVRYCLIQLHIRSDSEPHSLRSGVKQAVERLKHRYYVRDTEGQLQIKKTLNIAPDPENPVRASISMDRRSLRLSFTPEYHPLRGSEMKVDIEFDEIQNSHSVDLQFAERPIRRGVDHPTVSRRIRVKGNGKKRSTPANIAGQLV